MSLPFDCAILLSIAGAMLFTPAVNAPNDDVLSARVDAEVRQQMTDQKIPGISPAVARNGQVVKATRYGFANLEVRASVKPDTIFEAASITKQFTATAVMP